MLIMSTMVPIRFSCTVSLFFSVYNASWSSLVLNFNVTRLTVSTYVLRFWVFLIYKTMMVVMKCYTLIVNISITYLFAFFVIFDDTVITYQIIVIKLVWVSSTLTIVFLVHKNHIWVYDFWRLFYFYNGDFWLRLRLLLLLLLTLDRANDRIMTFVQRIFFFVINIALIMIIPKLERHTRLWQFSALVLAIVER